LDIETIFNSKGLAKAICIAITKNNKVDFKCIKANEVNNTDIVKFMLKKCSSKKIYYVHNLTFEIYVFLNDLKREGVKFKIISSNKNVYSATLLYGKKKIHLRCSLKLTMLPLKKLAELSEINDKGIFPYEILKENLKEKEVMLKEYFENEEEFNRFVKRYGSEIETYKILKEYCINDAVITKQAIIKF